MKKILILSFDELENIYLSTSLAINSLKRFQDSDITLLTKKSFQRCSETLTFIDSFSYINDEKINFILNNDQISDELAYKELLNDINIINTTAWDEIYCTSSNKTTSLIASAIKAKQYQTTVYGNDSLLVFSNKWQIQLKSIELPWNFSSISYIDVLNRSSGFPVTSIREHLDNEISFPIPLSLSAKENFEMIRNRVSQLGKEVRLVGIVIDNKFELSDLAYAKIIDKLITSSSLYPIVIYNNSIQNKQIINHLNNEFNDSLLSVSSNYQNLGAILENIDVTVSFDLTATRIAESIDTPIIHVCKNIKSLDYNYTTNETVQILIDTLNPQNLRDLASDIIQCSKLKCRDSVETIESSNKVFISQTSSLGLHLAPLYGNHAKSEFFERELSRVYAFNLCEGQIKQTTLAEIFSRFDEKTVGDYITAQKGTISLMVKHTINTLRYLEENTSETVIFNSIKSLIKAGAQSKLLSVNSAQLKTKIENTSLLNDSELKNVLSPILLETKNNLKSLVYLFNEILNATKNHSHSAQTSTKLMEKNE